MKLWWIIKRSDLPWTNGVTFVACGYGGLAMGHTYSERAAHRTIRDVLMRENVLAFDAPMWPEWVTSYEEL